MLKNIIKEDIMIYKDYVIINAYNKLIDITDKEIKIISLTIHGEKLKIKELTKDYMIIVGKIKEIIFHEN